MGAGLDARGIAGAKQLRRSLRLAGGGGDAPERPHQVGELHPVIHVGRDPQGLGQQRSRGRVVAREQRDRAEVQEPDLEGVEVADLAAEPQPLGGCRSRSANVSGEEASSERACSSCETAAAVAYGGLMALHYLRRGDVHDGDRVLVYGASGSVGTAAVQLARHAGAVVTGVCGPGNLELVRSLGAASVVDYTAVDAPPDGAAYDLVLDAVGKRRGSRLKDACRGALADGGRWVSVDDGTPDFPAADLDRLAALVDAGVLAPVIDRVYPLERIVDAHRYVESDHKRGNVVITMA